MKKDNQKLAQEEQRRKNAKNRIKNELDRKALIETQSFAALVSYSYHILLYSTSVIQLYNLSLPNLYLLTI